MASTRRCWPGTDNAENPFWSPDSQFIGFFAQRKLGKISTIYRAGRLIQVLWGKSIQPRGATWNQDGVIVFSANDGLTALPLAAGGRRSRATPIHSRQMERTRERYWPAVSSRRPPFHLPRGRPQRYWYERGHTATRLSTPNSFRDACTSSAVYSPRTDIF